MQTKRGRWFWVLLAALAFVSIALLASALEKQPSEGKVAVASGSVITQEDFDAEMSRKKLVPKATYFALSCKVRSFFERRPGKQV
jgi:hypothetical protein